MFPKVPLFLDQNLFVHSKDILAEKLFGHVNKLDIFFFWGGGGQ